jgi:hypothetical protein
MSGRQSDLVDGLVKFWEAAWLDLPRAAARQVAGQEDEKVLGDAGWKIYEAWVNLANAAANTLYANRAFSAVTGRTIETALRLQRAGDALSSAFFGNLWPALGLPTASQIHSLREEVIALRAEAARSASVHGPAVNAEARAERPATTEEGLRVIRNGSSRETTLVNGNGTQRAAA